MKYIITGATGHIGNNLVKHLVKQGKQVKVLVRKVDESIKGLPIEYAIGNVFDKSFLASNVETGDVLFHLAAIIDIKNKKRDETLKINYEGTKILADFCLENQVRFVYASSVEALNIDNSSPETIIEPTELNPELIKSNYGYSKAMATKYVLDLIKANKDFNAAVVYPSAVIGVNDYKPSAVGKVVLDTIHGKVQFGVKGGYNFIDVDDLSVAMINLADSQYRDDYFLTGDNITIIELYHYLNQALGKPRKIIRIPILFVRIAARFVPYLSKFTIGVILSRHDFSNEKAKKDLNLEITPFTSTIKKTVEWFKNKEI